MWYIIIGGLCFVVGVLAQKHVSEVENLSKEDYARCVQIILNEYQGRNTPVQNLLDEISNYACDEKVTFGDLSVDARAIVNKVQSIIN